MEAYLPSILGENIDASCGGGVYASWRCEMTKGFLWRVETIAGRVSVRLPGIVFRIEVARFISFQEDSHTSVRINLKSVLEATDVSFWKICSDCRSVSAKRDTKAPELQKWNE